MTVFYDKELGIYWAGGKIFGIPCVATGENFADAISNAILAACNA